MAVRMNDRFHFFLLLALVICETRALNTRDASNLWCEIDGCPEVDKGTEVLESIDDIGMFPSSYEYDDISNESAENTENEQDVETDSGSSKDVYEKSSTDKGTEVLESVDDVRFSASSYEYKYESEYEQDVEVDSGSSKDVYEKSSITNSLDNEIRESLDEADGLMEQGRFVEANKMYERLLQRHTNSPRARYGVALAHEKVSEQAQSNPLLDKAITGYEQVLDMKGVPNDLAIMAAQHLFDSSNFRQKDSFRALRELAVRQPHRLDLQNKYAKKLFDIGQKHDAKTVFADVLKRDSTDGMAQSYYGLLLKLVDDKLDESVRYMLSGIATGAEGSQDRIIYTYLGNGLMRQKKREEAYKIQAEGAAKGYFLSAKQRSVYNVDRLTGRPWWTMEQTTYETELKEIERKWKVIREEALSLIRNHRHAITPDSEQITTKGKWDKFTLYRKGEKVEENCKLVPRTCELISKFKAATSCSRGQIKFSILEGGSEIFPHCGPTNCRVRGHLGLVIPPGAQIRVGGETRSWIAGKFIILDDSFEHEVWHNGTDMRLILIVDFWHPELTQKERSTLSPI